MACELTQGYAIDCRDNVGGIKSVYLSNFDNVTSYTSSAGVISALTQAVGKSFFKYNLEKENGQFDEKLIPSVDNGTAYYEGTLTHTVKKITAAMQQEIRLIGLSRLFIIIEDNNGTFWTFGADNGADLTEAASSTGKAFGDMNGTTLTFSSKEKFPMQEVPQAVMATLTVV